MPSNLSSAWLYRFDLIGAFACLCARQTSVLPSSLCFRFVVPRWHDLGFVSSLLCLILLSMSFRTSNLLFAMNYLASSTDANASATFPAFLLANAPATMARTHVNGCDRNETKKNTAFPPNNKTLTPLQRDTHKFT